MATEFNDQDYNTREVTTVVKRISWGAVFAGLAVVLVTQLTLGVLGIGIGAGVVNLEDSSPDQGVRIGAMIWLVFTALISLFLGGHVAARLAGMPRKEDSCLHGILTWSAQTLATVLLVTTTVGGVMGGMIGLLGKGISGAGQGLAGLVSQPDAMGGVGAAVEKFTGVGGSEWNAIKEDAKSMLSETNQGASAKELQRAMGQMFSPTGGQASPQDREALVNAVAAHTQVSPQQAEQRVARWEQMQQQVQQKVQETKQDVKEVAGTAAKGVSKVALWTFLTLILGAAAAALGGISGRPKTLLTDSRTAAV